MIRTVCFLLLGAISPLALSTPAAGAIVALEWSGLTSFGGNDGLDLFGLAGQNVGDLPYTATFVYDTAIQFSENGTNGSQQVSGGTFFNPNVLPIPLVRAEITLNGMSVGMSGQYASTYARQSGQGASQVLSLAQREGTSNPARFGGELFQRVFRLGNFYDSALLEVLGSHDFTADDSPGGNFTFVNLDENGFISGPSTGISLIPSRLVIRSVDVPEPGAATLAFGMVAATTLGLRRTCRYRPRG